MKKLSKNIIYPLPVENRNGKLWYTAITKKGEIEYGPFDCNVSADAHHEESRRIAYENGRRS